MEGKDLRKRREKLGLTQTALAEILEVKPNTVTRWENGVLPISKTVELAFENVECKLKKAKTEEEAKTGRPPKVKGEK